MEYDSIKGEVRELPWFKTFVILYISLVASALYVGYSRIVNGCVFCEDTIVNAEKRVALACDHRSAMCCIIIEVRANYLNAGLILHVDLRIIDLTLLNQQILHDYFGLVLHVECSALVSSLVAEIDAFSEDESAWVLQVGKATEYSRVISRRTT